MSLRILAKHAALALFISAPVGIIAANQGCGLNHDYCDVYCECELCNDRSEDACQVQVGATLDAADEYDCTDEAEAYINCVIDESDCDDDDNQFEIEPDCIENELDDLFDCIDDNSDLDVVGPSGPGPGPGPGGGAELPVVCSCLCDCDTAGMLPGTRTCQPGETGCESCDVVCTDTCTTAEGTFLSATGACS